MRGRVIVILAIVLAIGLALSALPVLKRGLLARNCLDNMKSMGYAAGIWSLGHAGASPTNWLCFSTELITPRMMLCPADSGRAAATEWANFGPENTSYELAIAGGPWGNSNRVFFRCKVHGYVCLADGSVSRHAP